MSDFINTSNQRFLKNTEYEVLSGDNTFKDFDGLLIGESDDVYEYDRIKATGGQLIKINDEWCRYDDLPSEKLDGMFSVYDLLEVKDNNSYKIDDKVFHQSLIVDEAAFIQDKLSEEFDKSVFPTISSVSNDSEKKDAKIILISTPKGVNNFYTKWKKAINGKSSFTPFEVKWSDVPGRDENFKKKIIDNFGLQYWNQEYACVSGDSLLDVKIDGIEMRITMEELYNLI
jgi:hypothetical protein